MTKRTSILIALASIIFSIGLVLPVMAQSQSSSSISDDAVNDIAEHMFCPVCENEPLDDCRTPTCVQWKEEIRDRLAAGQSQEEIMNYFVENYGQHVLSIPQEPILRLLSFLIPIVGGIVAVAVGALAVSEFQGNRPNPLADPTRKTKSSPDETDDGDNDDPYRQMIESDLK